MGLTTGGCSRCPPDLPREWQGPPLSDPLGGSGSQPPPRRRRRGARATLGQEVLKVQAEQGVVRVAVQLYTTRHPMAVKEATTHASVGRRTSNG